MSRIQLPELNGIDPSFFFGDEIGMVKIVLFGVGQLDRVAKLSKKEISALWCWLRANDGQGRYLFEGTQNCCMS